MGACPVNCHCQWGVSGIFSGIFIMLAAGVFTFFPVVLGLFKWQWYIYLCWFWFGLGVFLFVCGVTAQCFGCTPKLESREHTIVDEETGKVTAAPAPYIM